MVPRITTVRADACNFTIFIPQGQNIIFALAVGLTFLFLVAGLLKSFHDLPQSIQVRLIIKYKTSKSVPRLRLFDLGH